MVRQRSILKDVLNSNIYHIYASLLHLYLILTLKFRISFWNELSIILKCLQRIKKCCSYHKINVPNEYTSWRCMFFNSPINDINLAHDVLGSSQFSLPAFTLNLSPKYDPMATWMLVKSLGRVKILILKNI